MDVDCCLINNDDAIVKSNALFFAVMLAMIEKNKDIYIIIN